MIKVEKKSVLGGGLSDRKSVQREWVNDIEDTKWQDDGGVSVSLGGKLFFRCLYKRSKKAEVIYSVCSQPRQLGFHWFSFDSLIDPELASL